MGNLPNFIGIGAQRAGTTWVYRCLREHPEVFMPEKKEIHFFSSNFHQGAGWYSEYFSPQIGQNVCGEITPNYLNYSYVPERIFKLVPSVKLFVILREPVDRALSAYHLFYEQRYKGKSFSEVCKYGSEIVNLGLYYEHLRYFYDYFTHDNIKVFLYEDIKENPRVFFEDICEYIGVSPYFTPNSLNVRYNRVIYPDLQKLFRLVGCEYIVDSVKETWLGKWIKKQHAQKEQINCLGTGERKKLQKLFVNDISKLESLINKDLSSWFIY